MPRQLAWLACALAALLVARAPALAQTTPETETPPAEEKKE